MANDNAFGNFECRSSAKLIEAIIVRLCVNERRISHILCSFQTAPVSFERSMRVESSMGFSFTDTIVHC